MKDLTYEEVYDISKKMIFFLYYEYGIKSRNNLETKLFEIVTFLDFNRFKSIDDLKDYLFISLKNYCKDLKKEAFKYNSRNIYLNEKNNNLKYLSNLQDIDIDMSNIYFEDLIRNLNQKQKKVAIMKFKEDKKNSEIADILGVSKVTVNDILNKIKHFVKEEL